MLLTAENRIKIIMSHLNIFDYKNNLIIMYV